MIELQGVSFLSVTQELNCSLLFSRESSRRFIDAARTALQMILGVVQLNSLGPHEEGWTIAVNQNAVPSLVQQVEALKHRVTVLEE